MQEIFARNFQRHDTKGTGRLQPRDLGKLLRELAPDMVLREIRFLLSAIAGTVVPGYFPFI